MKHIKNRRLILYLKELLSYKNVYKHVFKLTNMYLFELIIYVVINKKIKNYLKSNVEKKIFIDYDDNIIYRIYITINQKIERVKNFDIYNYKLTSKINIEFDKNFINFIINLTIIIFFDIHIEITTKN